MTRMTRKELERAYERYAEKDKKQRAARTAHQAKRRARLREEGFRTISVAVLERDRTEQERNEVVEELRNGIQRFNEHVRQHKGGKLVVVTVPDEEQVTRFHREANNVMARAAKNSRDGGELPERPAQGTTNTDNAGSLPHPMATQSPPEGRSVPQVHGGTAPATKRPMPKLDS